MSLEFCETRVGSLARYCTFRFPTSNLRGASIIKSVLLKGGAGVDLDKLSLVPFFRDIVHEQLPETVMPRMPYEIARHNGDPWTYNNYQVPYLLNAFVRSTLPF